PSSSSSSPGASRPYVEPDSRQSLFSPSQSSDANGCTVPCASSQSMFEPAGITDVQPPPPHAAGPAPGMVHDIIVAAPIAANVSRSQSAYHVGVVDVVDGSQSLSTLPQPCAWPGWIVALPSLQSHGFGTVGGRMYVGPGRRQTFM